MKPRPLGVRVGLGGSGVEGGFLSEGVKRGFGGFE